MTAVKVGERGQEPLFDPGDHPDADLPTQEAGELVNRGPDAHRGSERGTGEGQDRLSGRGRADLPHPAFEQGLTELGLELTNLRADPGLGNVLALRGPGEAPLFGDRDDVGELVELHKC